MKMRQCVDGYTVHYDIELVASSRSTRHPRDEDLSVLAKLSLPGALTEQAVLPPAPKRGKKPWISQRTLDLVAERSVARNTGDWLEERRLHKKIRASGGDVHRM